MKINTILVLILSILFCLVVPFFILLVKDRKKQNILSLLCLVLFLIALFVGVFGKLDFNWDYVQISFDFSGKWCNKTINWTFSNISTFDLVINLVMLIPIGIFAFHYLKINQFWRKIVVLVAVGVLCGTFIETMQFVLPIPRSVQLSDVVFNAISVTLGGLICALYSWIVAKINRQN